MELYVRILNAVANVRKSEDGVTAIEYGLIAALIAVAIIVILGTVGDALVTVFTSVADGLTGAA